MALQDMFLLSPDKHDDTGVKWRWQGVKQVGQRPSVRTGLSTAVGRDRVYMFGGVADQEEPESDSDEEEDSLDDGTFHNDLYTVTVEGERATWHLLQLTGTREDKEKKKRRKPKEGEVDEQEEEEVDMAAMDGLALGDGPSTVTVESGAFTVSSTVSSTVGTSELSFLSSLGAAGGAPPSTPPILPSPRFNAGMAFKGGNLYLFGGLWEKGEKDFTLKDFYSLDTKKLDNWTVLVEDDVKTMEWVEDEEDEEEEAEEDEDESGMETD